MTKTVQAFYPSPHPCALIRKKRLLELLPFCKTTLHAKLTEGGRYQDTSFPRPIYLPHGRTPFWREAEVLAWIEACTLSSRSCEIGKDAPQRAVGVRSLPSVTDINALQAQEPGKCRSDDATGESPSKARERVETTIGERSVVLSVRKLSPRYIKRATSPDTGP